MAAIQALLVLDVQNVYFSKDSGLYVRGCKDVLNRINKLIRLFTARNDLVILTRHAHRPDHSDLGRMFDFAGSTEEPNFIEGTEEVELFPGLELPGNHHTITKTRYSAFQSTLLESLLKKNKVTNVTVCGFMTNFCCESTVRGAHDRDYFVDLVLDATGCPPLGKITQDLIKRVTAATLAEGFARIVRTRDLVRRAT